MLTIANVPTQTVFVDALTLGPVAKATQITYLVANAAAVVQLAPLVESGTTEPWGPELLIPPSSGTFVHAGGIRFRSALPGSPAQVVAQLSQPGDPVAAGSTPFTDFLSNTGAINPAGVTDWADLTGYGAWTRDSADAPTYVLTVPADVSAVFSPGMRLKWTQGGITGYGIITAVGAYVGGATKVTLYGGTDYSVTAGAIAAIAYATTKAPLGFPLDPLKWTVELRDTVQRAQAAPVAGTWYNLGSLSISVPIGSWRITTQVQVDGYSSTVNAVSCYSTLSTANNTQSDSDLTSSVSAEAATDPGGPALEVGAALSRRKFVTVAAKTAYFLNAKAAGAGLTAIYFNGGISPTIVRAECAYL